jgi:hypothetical protein
LGTVHDSPLGQRIVTKDPERRAQPRSPHRRPRCAYVELGVHQRVRDRVVMMVVLDVIVDHSPSRTSPVLGSFHSVAFVASAFALTGCGTTIGGAHITSPTLAAGRRSLTKDFEKERVRGTPISVAPLDVVGFWCPEKEHPEKCTPLDAATARRLESIASMRLPSSSEGPSQVSGTSDPRAGQRRSASGIGCAHSTAKRRIVVARIELRKQRGAHRLE